MVKLIEPNYKVDIVCGNISHEQRSNLVFGSGFGFSNKLIALTHNLINGINLDDPLTGLRVIRADLLRNWQVQSKGFDVEVELNYCIGKMGYELKEVPIQYRTRIGEKKLKPKDGDVILKRVMIGATTRN